jgi:hypothetical protein
MADDDSLSGLAPPWLMAATGGAAAAATGGAAAAATGGATAAATGAAAATSGAAAAATGAAAATAATATGAAAATAAATTGAATGAAAATATGAAAAIAATATGAAAAATATGAAAAATGAAAAATGAAAARSPPLTALTMFVCTYVAKLGGLRVGFAELTAALCRRPHGCLLAVNSNFGHAAQPGCEAYLKATRPPARPRAAPARNRDRKVQGDGTCFNSAVEPVVRVDHPGLPAGKVYKAKYFPTTGETQVPGVIRPDLSDGHAVLVALVAHLNAVMRESNLAGAALLPGDAVTIEQEQPKMLNFKFCVCLADPRMIVDLHGLAAYFVALERAVAVEGGAPLTPAQQAWFAGWPAVVMPPLAIRETKPPTDHAKISLRFVGARRNPRVNIFQSGKVNILGADSPEVAGAIYDYFSRVFAANWARLVRLKPRPDNAARAASPAPLEARRPGALSPRGRPAPLDA